MTRRPNILKWKKRKNEGPLGDEVLHELWSRTVSVGFIVKSDDEEPSRWYWEINVNRPDEGLSDSEKGRRLNSMNHGYTKSEQSARIKLEQAFSHWLSMITP